MVKLLRLRSAIEMTTSKDMKKDLARLCLAGTIEPVSALRRDGRALRHMPDKHRPNVLDEFLRRSSIITADMDSCSTSWNTGHVYLGDMHLLKCRPSLKAKPLSNNAYKIPITEALIRRAIVD